MIAIAKFMIYILSAALRGQMQYAQLALCYTPGMAMLLQSPSRALSMADVAGISQTLAENLGRIVLKTEGFSVEDYFSLEGPNFLEYVDGCLQVLPMPDSIHQALAITITNLLIAFSKNDLAARTIIAPFPTYLNDRKYREPDVCFMRGINAHRRNKNSGPVPTSLLK